MNTAGKEEQLSDHSSAKFIVIVVISHVYPMHLSYMCLYVETPKTIIFPFGTNGKSMVLGIPVL